MQQLQSQCARFDRRLSLSALAGDGEGGNAVDMNKIVRGKIGLSKGWVSQCLLQLSTTTYCHCHGRRRHRRRRRRSAG
jgi:hypothetical protein